MKNFKKITSLVLAFVLVLALCACGDKNKDNDATPPDNGTEGNDTQNPEPTAFDGNIELALPNGTKVTASAETNSYFISKTETFYAIINKNDKTDSTLAKVAYIYGKTAANIAPSYIETEVGEFDNLEFPGTVQIGAEGIYADMCTASNDKQYVEAYLINVEGGVVAVLIAVSNDLKEAELPVLKNIVNTLSIG